MIMAVNQGDLEMRRVAEMSAHSIQTEVDYKWHTAVSGAGLRVCVVIVASYLLLFCVLSVYQLLWCYALFIKWTMIS